MATTLREALKSRRIAQDATPRPNASGVMDWGKEYHKHHEIAEKHLAAASTMPSGEAKSAHVDAYMKHKTAKTAFKNLTSSAQSWNKAQGAAHEANAATAHAFHLSGK